MNDVGNSLKIRSQGFSEDLVYNVFMMRRAVGAVSRAVFVMQPQSISESNALETPKPNPRALHCIIQFLQRLLQPSPAKQCMSLCLRLRSNAMPENEHRHRFLPRLAAVAFVPIPPKLRARYPSSTRRTFCSRWVRIASCGLPAAQCPLAASAARRRCS